jgi:hypothetical protein
MPCALSCLIMHLAWTEGRTKLRQHIMLCPAVRWWSLGLISMRQQRHAGCTNSTACHIQSQGGRFCSTMIAPLGQQVRTALCRPGSEKHYRLLTARKAHPRGIAISVHPPDTLPPLSNHQQTPKGSTPREQ